MKKLLALVTGLAAAGSAFASPVLSPAAAAVHTDGVFFCDDCSCWSLRAGFRGDYVWNRHLKNLTAYRIFSNSGVLTLNVWDRVDAYGFVGAASEDFAANLGTTYVAGNIETKTIWGVGIRATLWEAAWGCCGTTYFGIDGNYESVTNGNFTTVTSNGAPSPAYLNTHYNEWQVSLQAGQRINLLTPYVAIKWSNAHAYLNTAAGTSLGSTDSSRNFGYAVGVALVDSGRMSVTAEARFVDEKAATIQAEFRF